MTVGRQQVIIITKFLLYIKSLEKHKNTLFFTIRIIVIPHFACLAIWLFLQDLNSSGLFCALDQNNYNKNGNLNLDNWDIILSYDNLTMPSSKHNILFSNIVHVTSIRQMKCTMLQLLANMT